jgi:hypothetical protein
VHPAVASTPGDELPATDACGIAAPTERVTWSASLFLDSFTNCPSGLESGH